MKYAIKIEIPKGSYCDKPPTWSKGSKECQYLNDGIGIFKSCYLFHELVNPTAEKPIRYFKCYKCLEATERRQRLNA